MTLSEYLQTQGLNDYEFAARIGVSQSTVNRAKRGLLDLRVEVALAVEAATDGEVDAATLSSDVRKVRESGPVICHTPDFCIAARPLSGGSAGDVAPLPVAGADCPATQLAGAGDAPLAPAPLQGRDQ